MLCAMIKVAANPNRLTLIEHYFCMRDFLMKARFKLLIPILFFIASCSNSNEKVPFSEVEEAVANSCQDRKSTRLNSSHVSESRMPSSA